jgi:RimJ/RimL family protein N-acetyltransferase
LGGEAVSDLIRYFPNGPYSKASELSDWLERSGKELGWVTCIFRSRVSGDVVGMASYMRPDPANGVVEVGSVAHGAAMARTPMSTEAHYLMARHVFEDLDYRRYEWKCHNLNEPSKDHRNTARVRVRGGFPAAYRRQRDEPGYGMVLDD